ncbi:MAG: acetate/propionate family kinase [Acidobacteria bacterium]|nr:acetate/propionate family kinase [Acidobacteriota bacterium]
MAADNAGILTINGGSSSIRFAMFEAGEVPQRQLSGKIDRIGASGTTLLLDSPAGKAVAPLRMAAADHRTAVAFLLDWLAAEPLFASVQVVAHRVVHGMKHSEPERVTAKLLAELRRITPYAPDHLPREIGLIEAFQKRYPKLPQVVCFDTAFHRTMPPVARLLPIPRRYSAKGVERYGFHGLSYAYLMEALRAADPVAAKGRVILAHLGHGASLAAIRDGRSVDTSMGLTPAAGLVMGTRTGDVDPGLVGYLSRAQGLTAARFEHMANHESGLLGVSGTSADMRDLLARETTDGRAAEAIALFCYQAKKWIGSFAAVLGGLDALVFAGGVGENAPVVRARICEGLGFLGVSLDKRRNGRNAALISINNSPVAVRVIATDEEIVLAKLALQVLSQRGEQRTPRAR